MKPAIFFLLSVICFCVAFFYMGMTVQSVDYHDGRYHPIPRERYVITFVASSVATVCFWKLGRRGLRPTGGAA